MRIKEINALSIDDRSKKLADLRVELSRIRTMVNAGGAIENPTRIRELRRTIAQILTIQNEKKLGIRQVPPKREKKQAPPTIKSIKMPKTKKKMKETSSK